MHPEEELIWTKICQRDLSAFEAFYKENYKMLYISCYRYVGHAELAQEIVNDAFLKIWESSGQINLQSSLKSYLYRTVVNMSLNAIKKEATAKKNLKSLASFSDTTTVADPDLEVEELKLQLYKAIDRLPPQCKKVFLLSRHEGLKQQEIADQLGISIKTVKNHITYALRQLADSVNIAIPVVLLLYDYFRMN